LSRSVCCHGFSLGCVRGLPPRPTLLPYPTLFRSSPVSWAAVVRPMGASVRRRFLEVDFAPPFGRQRKVPLADIGSLLRPQGGERSEEHTSELQSRENLVCRLLLEKKKHTSMGKN